MCECADPWWGWFGTGTDAEVLHITCILLHYTASFPSLTALVPDPFQYANTVEEGLEDHVSCDNVR